MCLRMCLRLRRGRFHGEIRIIVFTLVLASLVKTRLYALVGTAVT